MGMNPEATAAGPFEMERFHGLPRLGFVTIEAALEARDKFEL